MSGLLTWPGLGMNLCDISNNVLWFCVMVLMFCVMVFMFCVTVLILSSKSFCFLFRMSNFPSSLLSSTRTSSSLSNVFLFCIFSLLILGQRQGTLCPSPFFQFALLAPPWSWTLYGEVCISKLFWPRRMNF